MRIYWKGVVIWYFSVFMLSEICLGESILGNWTTINNTNFPRAGLTSVVVDSTIYVMGGDYSASSVPSPVEKAFILPSNNLSSWIFESTQMVSSREGHISVSANGYLYAIGGTNYYSSPSTAERAKINPDSTLGEWTTISQLPFSMYACSVVTANGNLYIIGGYSSRSSIYRCSLNTDGTLGQWILSTSFLNIGRDGTGATVFNGHVYVACGINGSSIGLTKTIERAQIYPDGELSSFFIISSTQDFHTDATLAKIGNYLYIIGGYQGGNINYRVERAKINPDMSVGPWEPGTYLVQERGAYGYSQTMSAVYVIDGAAGVPISSVERAFIISDTGIEPEKWQGLE